MCITNGKTEIYVNKGDCKGMCKQKISFAFVGINLKDINHILSPLVGSRHKWQTYNLKKTGFLQESMSKA